MDDNREFFESSLLAGKVKPLLGWERSPSDRASWSSDRRTRTEMRRKIMRIGTREDRAFFFFSVSTPGLDDHQVQKEEPESVGEVPEVCSHIGLECLFVAHRQTHFLSVNCLARAVTIWNRACDEQIGQDDILHSLRELIQAIWPRGKHSIKNAKLDCFKMLILRVNWQLQDQRQDEFLFQLGGLVRNRLPYLPVLLKQKSFLWTLVCV